MKVDDRVTLSTEDKLLVLGMSGLPVPILQNSLICWYRYHCRAGERPAGETMRGSSCDLGHQSSSANI